MIKNGITEGLNSDEILAMVKKANVNESRASTIVRTELSIINNEISYKVAINSGISYWQWSCNGPAEDVPCREACGEIVSVGSMFPNGLTRPPVHANCMCGVDYVTDARTLRSAGIDTSQEEINARYRPNIYK